ncbi:MAG TPA: hypothetical protein DEB39_06965 [Planctomycetaceae bacterium]|nr:hypothetical protein [Planctomycetaceae bacterium]
MEFFNTVHAQLRDLVNGMTPGSRIIAALLLAVLVVSLAFLVVGSRSEPAENQFAYVFGAHEFTNSEQRAAEAAFEKAGLGDYSIVGSKIKVPAKRKSEYAAALVNGGVIRDSGDFLNTAAENIGPFDPAHTIGIKMLQATGKEIAETIKRFDGVQNATVTPFERWDRPAGRWDKVKIRTAGVVVWPLNNKPLPNETVSMITMYVKQGLGITDIKDISISDGRTGQAYEPTDEFVVGSAEKSMLGAQKKQQEFWENTIYKALAYIDGVNVTASVEVEPLLDSRGLRVRHIKPASAVHTREAETSFNKNVINRHGRPGMVAQANQPLNLNMGPGMGSEETQKETTSQSEATMALQGDERNIIDAPFAPRRVNATVRIPRSYIRAIWARENARPGETVEGPNEEQMRQAETRLINDVKLEVANLIKDYRDPTVPDITESVVVLPFTDDPPAPVEPPTFMESTSAWLADNWSTLALIGIVSAGLFILWSITRPAKPDPIVIYEAPEIPAEELERRYAPSTEEEEEEIERLRTLTSFDKSMRSLQEEVAELVEENPDAAAAILRQWIGNVVAVEH